MSYFNRNVKYIDNYDYTLIQDIFARSKVKDFLFCTKSDSQYTEHIAEILRNLDENLKITLIFDSNESNNIVKYYTNSNILIYMAHSINPRDAKGFSYDIVFTDTAQIITNANILTLSSEKLDEIRSKITFNISTRMQEMYARLLNCEIAFDANTKQIIIIPNLNITSYYMVSPKQIKDKSMITKLMPPTSIFQKSALFEKLKAYVPAKYWSYNYSYIDVNKEIKNEMTNRARLRSAVYIGALLDKMLSECIQCTHTTKPYVINIPAVFHKNIINSEWENDRNNDALLLIAENYNWYPTQSIVLESHEDNVQNEIMESDEEDKGSDEEDSDYEDSNAEDDESIELCDDDRAEAHEELNNDNDDNNDNNDNDDEIIDVNNSNINYIDEIEHEQYNKVETGNIFTTYCLYYLRMIGLIYIAYVIENVDFLYNDDSNIKRILASLLAANILITLIPNVDIRRKCHIMKFIDETLLFLEMITLVIMACYYYNNRKIDLIYDDANNMLDTFNDIYDKYIYRFVNEFIE